MYNVSFIKWLYVNGYRQKNIQIITGYNQSYISKMVNSSRPFIPSIDNINQEQATRKIVVDRILECRSLPLNGFTEQDKAYIKLLDYCLVDREEIRKLYYNYSQYKISQALRQTEIDKDKFNPALIGLTDSDYKCFLEKADF